MKRSLPIWSLLLLFALPAAHAQLYKYTGPDGKVIYSDTPPPPNAKQVEKKSVSGGSSDVELPYELAQAVKNNPVTLYTGTGCLPCDEGRKMLNARGIPFAEKIVTTNDDIKQFRSAGGDSTLPLLVAGRMKQTGFQADAWGTTLTAAGYPETSKLPKNFRNSQAEAAAPKPATPGSTASAANNATETSPGAPERAAPTGNVPPGFRF
ncbi:hypothetical protein BH11PSE11_BH11PSE11_32030 [soil metagenome]